MTLKLVVTTNVEGDVFELVLKNARYGVGRRHDNDLRIKETYISGYHAELVRQENGDYVVRDLGSSNGTFLNGRRVNGNDVVKAGDFIKFGILKVAVKEQTETMPKIVSLRELPAFAKKDASHTASIGLERKTGNVAVVGEGSGETRPAEPSPEKGSSTRSIAEKPADDKERTALKKALEAAKLAQSKSESDAKARAEEVSSLRDELARRSAAEDESRLALQAKGKEAEALAGELETLRRATAESEATAAKQRGASEALLAAKEEKLQTLFAEKAALELELETRKRELGSSAEELAKIADAAAKLEEARKELGAARSKGASLAEESSHLADELKIREVALGEARSEGEALRRRVEELASEAEKDKTGLAKELEKARSQAEESAAELAALRKRIDAEERLRAAEATEGEKEAARLSKTLASLEAKLTKRDEEVAFLETKLRDSANAAKQLGSEGKRATKLANELAAAQDELAKARAELKTAAEAASGLEGRASELGSTLEEKNGRIAALEADLGELRAASDRNAAELAEKSALVDAAKTEAEALRAELLQRDEKNAAAEADAEEKARSLSAQLAAASEALAEKSALVDAAKTEAEALRAEAESLREESVAGNAARAEIATLSASLAEKEREIARSQRQLEGAQRLVGNAEIERSALRGELEQLRSLGDGAAAEVMRLREALEEARSERAGLDEETKRLSDDLHSAKAEANELRLTLNKERESSERRLAQLDSELRSQIAALETGLASEKVLAADSAAAGKALVETLESTRGELAKLAEESERLRSSGEESARQNGRLQAELNRVSAEREQVEGELAEVRERSLSLSNETERLQTALDAKARELADREREHARNEAEEVRRLKRELAEASSAREAAEASAAKAQKDKLTLSGSFDRLKEQLVQTENGLKQAKAAEEELVHGKGLLARRLEKAEAGNNELAARIKEEAMAAVASRNLIEKLEIQLRENESEAVRREQAVASALQADLSRAKRQSVEDERVRRGLEAELARTVEAHRLAEERIVALDARIVALETESASTRELLKETERRRGELASGLAAETALVATHLRTVEALREDLATTIARHEKDEREMLAKHGNEIDALSGELAQERERGESLAVELANTREGLSEAIRRTREEAAKAQAKLVAEANAKLSGIETELSEAIHAREEIEATRNALEDELNQREEDIERLSERLEDLGIALADESEARGAVLRELATTREGFSDSLRAYRGRLEGALAVLGETRLHQDELERSLAETQAEVESLGAAAEETDARHRGEVREWEERYEALREEKLTLASEDADLKKIRDQIRASHAEKRAVEEELAALGSGLRDLKEKHLSLQSQRSTLLAEREELKAALNAARTELAGIEKRRGASESQESKLGETIASAERRIQALRKLEEEMERAIERRRQNQLVSRGEVFAGPRETFPAESEFSQEEFYRKLIAKLDLIDDLAKRYDNKWLYPKIADQLTLLKRSFIELLQDHSVQQFALQPGTVLSVAERRRIKLVPLQNGNGRKTNGNGSNGHTSQVVETIRPGYVYQNGSQDVIIRKAEVLVS